MLSSGAGAVANLAATPPSCLAPPNLLLCLPGAALGLKGELLTLGIEAGHLGADGFLKVLGARLEGGVTGLGRALSLIFELVYCLLSLLAKAEVTRGTGR